jgi:signal transduction histidine kinase
MRAQLTGLVTVLLGVCLLFVTVPLLLLARVEFRQQSLVGALARAQALVPDAGDLPDGALPEVPADGQPAISVYRTDGTVLGVRAPIDPVTLRAVRDGQSRIGLDGRVDVLVPGLDGRSGAGPVVRVSVPDQDWEMAALRTWLLVVGTALVLLLAGTTAAEFVVRRQLGWLRELRGGAERLAAGELNIRIPTGGPLEINRVGAALNRAAVRVERLMEAERVRSADLAHRLRTPLTALRLGVDRLSDRAAAVRLGADLIVLNRAVDEVIRGVRWPHGPGAGTVLVEADLVAVTRERARFWTPLAEDTGRIITVRTPDDPLRVRAGRADLRAALDAVLGNVFAHTPAGVSLWVWVRAVDGGGGGGVVTVEDAGPGFPASVARRRGRSGVGFTGLGLDIAGRAAAESGGGMRLASSPAGGALVELSFGGPL